MNLTEPYYPEESYLTVQLERELVATDLALTDFFSALDAFGALVEELSANLKP